MSAYTPSLEFVHQCPRCLQVDCNCKQHRILSDKWFVLHPLKLLQALADQWEEKIKQSLKYIYLTVGKEQGKVTLKIQRFILGDSALLMHQTGEEETITGTTALGHVQHAKVLHGQKASTSTKAEPSLFTFATGETIRQPWDDKQTQDFLEEGLKWIKSGGIRTWGNHFGYTRSVPHLVVLRGHFNLLKASKNVEEA